jgi:hypothetical protein
MPAMKNTPREDIFKFAAAFIYGLLTFLCYIFDCTTLNMVYL